MLRFDIALGKAWGALAAASDGRFIPTSGAYSFKMPKGL
jgi:hypothetical protein